MNGWNLKITELRRNIFFQTSIFVFHVHFSGRIQILAQKVVDKLSDYKNLDLGDRSGTK